MLIFLCFLWTGSAYITWLYHLIGLFGNATADWLSAGVGYIFQAIGVLTFALFLKHKPRLAQSRLVLPCVSMADGLFVVVAVLSGAKAAALGFGLLMNLMHGVIAGIYLTKLATSVPQQKRGTVFGIAYGLGSIGSWLISLPMDDSFLNTNYSLIVYAVLIALTIFINHWDEMKTVYDGGANSFTMRTRDYALIASVVFLLSIVKGLGFYFPMAEPTSGAISLEFSRAFYAIGLIAAGLIGDKNRKYGAVCCVSALVFPFLSFALHGHAETATLLWILGYVFFGFFAVYRVGIYCDIAAKKEELLWLAGFGLLFGRVGDAAGTFGGILFEKNYIALISFSTALFFITVFLFFELYHKLYMPVLSQEKNEEQLLQTFETEYGLSLREIDVFRLIIKGRSNSEIAGDLYISESTVKFHVKNVLKKTECTNRTELTVKFRGMV